jgi:hypothetical protein
VLEQRIDKESSLLRGMPRSIDDAYRGGTMKEPATQRELDKKGRRKSSISTSPAPKRRGRQRSEESEEAILSAITDLLKGKPLRDISVEEIAREAGVGKATIYKWWPSKAYIAFDAFSRKLTEMVPICDTGSAE